MASQNETTTRKRRNSIPLSNTSSKVIKTSVGSTSASKRDDDFESSQLLTQVVCTLSSTPLDSQLVCDLNCNVCKQPASINSIEVSTLKCCLCESYVHGRCLDTANDALLEYLYVVAELGGWCCPTCRVSKKSGKTTKPTKASANVEHVNNELNCIKSQLSQLYHEFKAYSTSTPSTSSATGSPVESNNKTSYAEMVLHTGSSSTPSGLSHSVPQLDGKFRTAILSAVHSEFKSRDKRASNIVVTGLKPSKFGTDAIQFSELCETEFKFKPNIGSTSRLGRVIEGKIQPLLITLSSQEEVDEIMKKASLLRFSFSPSVRNYIYINRHMTRAESFAAYEARELRRSKSSKQASGDHNQEMDILNKSIPDSVNIQTSPLNPSAFPFQSSTVPTASTSMSGGASTSTAN